MAKKKGGGLVRQFISDIKRTGSKAETARRVGISPSTLGRWVSNGIPAKSVKAETASQRLVEVRKVDTIRVDVEKRGLSSVARDLGFSQSAVKNTLKRGVLPERRAGVWEEALDHYRDRQRVTPQDQKDIKSDLRTLDRIPGALDSLAQAMDMTPRKFRGWFEKVKSGDVSDETMRAIRDALDSARENLKPYDQGVKYLKDPRTGKDTKRVSFRWEDYQAPVLPHALPKADGYVVFGVDRDGKIICSTYENADLSKAIRAAKKKFKHYQVASFMFHLVYDVGR
jgi:hypothetical protein